MFAAIASGGIASPISWGALRPKILLTTDAVAARADADAVVAHELAHVTRQDWLKLMLVRVSVALWPSMGRPSARSQGAPSRWPSRNSPHSQTRMQAMRPRGTGGSG